MRALMVAACVVLALLGTARAADRLDPEPRVAVISAYEPEWVALKAAVSDARSHHVNGVEIITGTLAGRKVVLFLSGISMVNAAMTSQLVLDRFDVTAIVVSGIAGGVDPALRVGDVVVAGRWGQYLEAVFAREADGRFQPPPWIKTPYPNHGMIFPMDVGVRSARGAEKRFWFEADAGMLAAAGKIGAVDLKRCAADDACLRHAPRLVVGGNGVSGQAFVDNAAFRQYVSATFQAQVLDMESAAIAMVAYANGVPFIAFRSLSDLAGGGEGANELRTFFRLASDNAAAVVQRFLALWTPPR
ncbi:5'-methylthioadenosine/S-adenosylhomocysteine nucleosidase [Vineibacter terrae]|uniref:5'-methylthioadenosine/S-adenosylhomocysteine nucleosidase n=1 Tax=Vineibacter terrae TaxID=2586908 RepID=UPI002E2EB7BB|nr:5'-methylthioadenosine/S-adenosylhomocysteine nucleosidase [Vineibacter terrae]HEX2887906.1 5'-methylthioadenosine/S-adenosylhomocysteine nucleosidase [Vineibacter terrae]